jgi:hypothetical protein
MKRITLLLCVALLLLTVATVKYAAQDSAKSEVEQLLGRRTSIRTQRTGTATFLFKQALEAAKAPGGIVSASSCSDPTRLELSSLPQTLRDALDAITTVDRRYQWEISDSVINLIPNVGVPAFLNLHIARFEERNIDTVDEALKRLLSTPEMQRGIAGLNSSSRLLRGKLGYFEQPKTHTSKAAQGFTIIRKNTTVREVLNAIASTHGHAVWSYTEYHCGSDAFSLDFSIQ